MSEEQVRDWDAEARRQGWNPDADIPEEKRVDAQTFVERGEQFHGHLKGKVENLENQVASLRTTNAEFKKHTDKTLAKEKEAHEETIRQLEVVRSKAIDDGDGQTFTQTDQELHRLRSESTTTEDVQTQAKSDAQTWLANNQWYNDNPKLHIFADGLTDQISNEGFTGMAYFNEITRRTKELMPDEFSNPNRDAAAAVEPGGAARTDSNPKERTYDALSTEHKAQCDKFIAEIPGFTKEQYVEQYDWDQEDV